MPNRRWTRDEDILVLDLYFKHGRRDISSSHKDVDSLSDLIGRTNASVRMRMVNFAACDSENHKKGLDHVSRITRAVWDEFAHDEPRLRRAANEIRRKCGLDAD